MSNRQSSGRRMSTFFAANGIGVRNLHSFRLSSDGLAADRLVLSLPLAVNSSVLVADTLSELAAPRSVSEAVTALFPHAHELHVGHETHLGEVRWKVYLERRNGFEGEEPGTVFLAWKWKTASQPIRSTYRWVPLGSTESRSSALGMALDDNPELKRVLVRVVDNMQLGRNCGAEFDRLVVREPSIQRVSVDIDTSTPRIPVGELTGLLDLASALGLESDAIENELHAVRTNHIVRMAAGTSISGPFVTVYHQPFDTHHRHASQAGSYSGRSQSDARKTPRERQ